MLAMVGSLALGQELAGAIVGLMFSGGAALEETGPLGFTDDFAGEGQQGGGRDGVARQSQRAANPHGRGESGLEMQITGALLSCDPD